MSSLGNLLSGLDKRTLVLPLPVAPMTLLSGLADGRKSMRSEEAWNVSNGDDQSKQNETPTRWQLPGHPLPCGFYVRKGGGEGEKYVLMGAMSSVEKRWASKRGDDCEEKEEQSRGKKKFIAPLLMANLGMCRGSAPRRFLCAAEAPFPVGHFRYPRGEELTEATVEYRRAVTPVYKDLYACPAHFYLYAKAEDSAHGRGEAMAYRCTSQFVQRKEDSTSGDSPIRVSISTGMPVMQKRGEAWNTQIERISLR